MIRGLLISSLISINLFAGDVQDFKPADTHAEEASESNFMGDFFKVRQKALPADQETKQVKEDLNTELQKYAQEHENKKAQQATEKKRDEKIKKWEESIPSLEGNSTAEKFVNEIAKDAVRIAHEEGIYPSVMIAQAGLESNWGRSSLAQEFNNLMGTKGSWEGNTVVMNTSENFGSGDVSIDAGFSVYDSWGDSLARYGSLLRNGVESNPEIYSGTWRENADSYKEATAWLEGRYATDPNYSSKLNETIENYNLTQFDDVDVLTKDEINKIEVKADETDFSLTLPEGFTEVQADDSLHSIAEENNVSVDAIMEWNQLEEAVITEGQLLTVAEDVDPLFIENINEIGIDEKAKMFL